MRLNGAEGRSLGQPTLVALVLLACAGTLALALDGLSYWHDVRFLFATTQFPFPELLEGRFNPHEAWGIVDETATSGFYASKVLHLWILHLLFSVADPASGGLSAAVALSVLAMVASAAGVAAVVVRVTGAGGLRGAAILSFIFLPVVPYLAGKQLAEVMSLAVSVWALVPAWAGLQATKSNAVWRSGALAAVLLLLGALLRLDSLFGPAAFLLAAVALAEDGPPRLRALGFAAGILTTVGVAYGFVMLLLGVPPTAFSGYAMELLGAPSRPAALSVLAIGTFGGVAYAFAALAWLSPRRGAAALFLLWWLIAWFPSILMTASFGVEPRYLAQGAPPVAGLVTLGIEAIWSRTRTNWFAPLSILGTAVILATNWLAIQVMPYEVDRRALLASVSEIWDRSPDASILVPWAYTDFNFLRVMRSSAPIYGVNSPSEEVVTESPLVGAWRERYASWYGPSYLAEPEQLEALLDRGPVYYLGWHRYPPIEFSEDLARRLRLKRIEESIRGIDVLDHLETSWVWNWPEVSLIREGGVGQYEYYLVGPLDSSVGTP